jgi:hypothetical protein
MPKPSKQDLPRIGIFFVMILVLLVIGVEACLVIGLPIGPGSIATNLYWWTLMLMFALLVIAHLLISVASVAWSSRGPAIAAIVFFIVSMGWRIWAIVYFVLMLATCDGDLRCADNLDCLGGVTGVYSGPTASFLGLFIVTIIDVVIHISAIFVCFGVVMAASNRLVTARMSGGEDVSRDTLLPSSRKVSSHMQ